MSESRIKRPDEAIWSNWQMRRDRDVKWDYRFLELARHVAGWSKDPSTQVGAIIADDRKLVVGMGYNGFPRGVRDHAERYSDRETKYKMVVHAEVNAVLMAGERARNCTLYVWPSFSLPPVCNECCKVVIQAGIRGIVGYMPDENDPRVQRWIDSIRISAAMCDEAGVSFFGIPQRETVREPE